MQISFVSLTTIGFSVFSLFPFSSALLSSFPSTFPSISFSSAASSRRRSLSNNSALTCCRCCCYRCCCCYCHCCRQSHTIRSPALTLSLFQRLLFSPSASIQLVDLQPARTRPREQYPREFATRKTRVIKMTAGGFRTILLFDVTSIPSLDSDFELFRLDYA